MTENTKKRVSVNLSMTAEDHEILKRLARQSEKSVSGFIVEMGREKNDLTHEWPPLKLSHDTRERLAQFAYENHTTPIQAVADMIWKATVKNTVIRGQLGFEDIPSKKEVTCNLDDRRTLIRSICAV